MIPPNLTKKQVSKKTTKELEKIIENSSHCNRVSAIGNNQTVQYAFEELHKRKIIDCEENFCFKDCENNHAVHQNSH